MWGLSSAEGRGSEGRQRTHGAHGNVGAELLGASREARDLDLHVGFSNSKCQENRPMKVHVLVWAQKKRKQRTCATCSLSSQLSPAKWCQCLGPQDVPQPPAGV